MATHLLLGLAVILVGPACSQHQPCRDTRQGVDSGIVRVPDFGSKPFLNVSCQWSYTSVPNKQILLNVDSVNLTSGDFRESSLTIVLDDQVIEIPKSCFACLKRLLISSKLVKIIYTSVLLDKLSMNDSPYETEVGSFQIRYKTFDPTRCESPKQPLNGFATIVNRKIGQEVVYGCKSPYDVSGQDRAVCQVNNNSGSPIPTWSVGPPKCVINNCSTTIHRNARSGALSSPGFPLYILPETVDCRWLIQGDLDSQIQVSVTFLQLSGPSGSFGTLSLSESTGHLLRFFNETSEKKISFTAGSNELTVHLITSNPEPVYGGFYLEYQSVRGSCAEPLKPEFGQVVISGLTVGSVVFYQCQSGYVLMGEAESLCQSNWTWSSLPPRCVPHLDFQVQDFPAEDSFSTPRTPGEFSGASENILEGNFSTTEPEEPKITKPISRKSKVMPTEKLFKKGTGKSKDFSLTSNTPETALTSVTASSENTSSVSDIEGTNDNKEDRKKLFSVNAAEDKAVKNKNKENSTLIKHAQSSDKALESAMEPRLQKSPGPRPVLGKDSVQDNSEVLKEVLKEQEEDGEVDREDFLLGLKGYIIIGVSTALLLLLVAGLVALVVYRKKFPVRMRFGRKFSTFENPMYVSKDAQHTRELKRLTI